MDGSLSYVSDQPGHTPACRPQPSLSPGVRLTPFVAGQGPWILWTRLLLAGRLQTQKNPLPGRGDGVDDLVTWSANRGTTSCSRSRAACRRAVAWACVNCGRPDVVIEKKGQRRGKRGRKDELKDDARWFLHESPLWCAGARRYAMLSHVKRRSFKNRAAAKENPAKGRGVWGAGRAVRAWRADRAAGRA